MLFENKEFLSVRIAQYCIAVVKEIRLYMGDLSIPSSLVELWNHQRLSGLALDTHVVTQVSLDIPPKVVPCYFFKIDTESRDQWLMQGYGIDF